MKMFSMDPEEELFSRVLSDTGALYRKLEGAAWMKILDQYLTVETIRTLRLACTGAEFPATSIGAICKGLAALEAHWFPEHLMAVTLDFAVAVNAVIYAVLGQEPRFACKSEFPYAPEVGKCNLGSQLLRKVEGWRSSAEHALPLCNFDSPTPTGGRENPRQPSANSLCACHVFSMLDHLSTVLRALCSNGTSAITSDEDLAPSCQNHLLTYVVQAIWYGSEVVRTAKEHAAGCGPRKEALIPA